MEALFNSLSFGDKFFDPESGEDFVKINDNNAIYQTGGDNFEGEVVEFNDTDMVVI